MLGRLNPPPHPLLLVVSPCPRLPRAPVRQPLHARCTAEFSRTDRVVRGWPGEATHACMHAHACLQAVQAGSMFPSCRPLPRHHPTACVRPRVARRSTRRTPQLILVRNALRSHGAGDARPSPHHLPPCLC
eukprot:349641-Chlamydomonas_euryale.AAC.3